MNNTIKLNSGTIQLVPLKASDIIHITARLVKPITPILGSFGKDGKPDMDKLSEAIVDVLELLDPDDLVDCCFRICKRATILMDGKASVVVKDIDTFDNTLVGVSPDEFFVLLLEGLKFHKFPFLRKVKTNFAVLIEKINTISEDLMQENESNEK